MRRLVILVGAMAGTFLFTRASLMLRPNADVFLAGYNIHHLFTGVVILTICAIPLVVGTPSGRIADLLVAGFGIGLSLALDEVVYLIATDGSNQQYLSRVSWVGGVVFVSLACVYAVVVGRQGPKP
jgi:hypothetical protein